MKKKYQKKKIKNFLILTAIIIIIILGFFTYIFLNFGMDGIYITFFSIILIIGFIIWFLTEPTKKKHEEKFSFGEYHEKIAYHKKKGEIKAIRDMKEYNSKKKKHKTKKPSDLIRDLF